MTKGEPENRRRMTTGQRSGGVLVCVLVVLLMVGLIVAQSIQTLLVLRRDQSRRAELQQAQALLSLGESLARLHWEAVNETDESAASMTWIIDVHADEQAKIAASTRTAQDQQEVLIEVSYPMGTEREIRASRSYSLPAIRPEAAGS